MVRSERGQAAVESVGVTVAIALLVAALAVWMAGNVRPPAAPPDVIGHVADPLGLTARQVEQAWSRDDLPPWLDTAARGRGDRPIGRFLGRVGDGVVTTVVTAAEADWRFRRAVHRQFLARLEALARDPSQIVQPPDPDALTPEGVARRILGRGGDLVAYVRELRRMPPRDALLRLAEDGGTVGGDLLFDAADTLLRRGVGKALGRGRAPAPGRDAPRP
jgi:hypothetical protein